MPENWVQRPVVNTEAGTNPGAPLAWGSPENPDDAVAGYGYVAADTSKAEETFYYHSDHLGSIIPPPSLRPCNAGSFPG